MENKSAQEVLEINPNLPGQITLTSSVRWRVESL